MGQKYLIIKMVVRNKIELLHYILNIFSGAIGEKESRIWRENEEQDSHGSQASRGKESNS